MTIKTIQKGGGGPPSTIDPALKVLNSATAKKQNIKTNSPDKTFLKEALSFIELYSSNATNGYIHELTGDILAKQNKIELALAQYELASDKYNDETSQSIIAMKIANLGM